MSIKRSNWIIVSVFLWGIPTAGLLAFMLTIYRSGAMSMEFFQAGEFLHKLLIREPEDTVTIFGGDEWSSGSGFRLTGDKAGTTGFNPWGSILVPAFSVLGLLLGLLMHSMGDKNQK